MRALLIVVLVAILMVFLGWMTFSNSPNQATVTIETDKMKQDTEKVIEKGKEISEEAGRKARQTYEEIKEKNANSPDSAEPSDRD